MKACVFGCAGERLGAEERRFFREVDPLGFILFARNCSNPDQIRALTAELCETVGRPAPILIDQEGGRVQRLTPPHWRAAPSAARLADLYAADPEEGLALTRLNARLLAEDLYTLGITVNCGPVLDLAEEGGHGVIGDRAFSDDPEIVAVLARAWIEGMEAGGVAPMIKHLPGHGRARVDSHLSLPVIDAPLDALIARDFRPFVALSDCISGMTGHLLFQAIDPDQPSTLSARLVGEVIRDHIGFDGLLFTDDLSMQALQGDLATRTHRALAAGCDIGLHCNGEMDEMRAVAAAASDIAGAARVRTDRFLTACERLGRERAALDVSETGAALARRLQAL